MRAEAISIDRRASNTAELTREAIEAANEGGRIIRETQPHAAAVRYDTKTDRVIVGLANVATFTFLPGLVEGLEDTSPAEIAEVEGVGLGFGLHWEALDLDYTVPGAGDQSVLDGEVDGSEGHADEFGGKGCGAGQWVAGREKV